MLRKVKQKQYKSKKEFQDDLDLIWSNCYTYNATEVSFGFFKPFFCEFWGLGVGSCGMEWVWCGCTSRDSIVSRNILFSSVGTGSLSS